MGDNQNRDHWDALGAQYSDNWASPGQRHLSEKETSFVVEHLPARPALSVLDVGIGNGRILEKLLADVRVDAVYGVDISAQMVAVCEKRFASQSKVKGLWLCDVARESLPVPPDLDFISAIRVVKYSRNWWDIIEDKLMPQLAPGGVVVFSMPNATSIKRFSRPYAVDYFATTEKELRERLARSGAEVVAVSGFSKVPDAVYRACRRPALTRSLLAVERGMDHLFGPSRLTREIFVAARRAA